MYVVMNELKVDPEHKDDLKSRFEKSLERMKEVPGCLEFLFLESETETDILVAYTKWDTKESYENWLESDAFKKAHGGKSGKEQSSTTTNQLRAFEVALHT
ncbi:antibiotic biosynthesis monooxygenase family protein [Natribacillus halophilus]|uniref:Heme oxygenase (Staphylobilin-producing) n=1 Tax=Natribacillus halophilus TaxID=549003 RepID=A0A1G8NT40_9BACI|nr:antibiotic biosynthesis monooxygenase family protein [Natribacillus halophilus]SDI83441.1 heme oxygenase (staphylobilin-producing) [Natribacillus halophilus]